MNTELLNQLNKKFEQVMKDENQIDLDLEDSMADDFAELFGDEFGAKVDTGSYRAHGWYYMDFILNDKKGVLYYYPLDNGGDIKYDNRYMTKNGEPMPIEELFSKFHELVDNNVNASTRMPRTFTKYPSNYVKAMAVVPPQYRKGDIAYEGNAGGYQGELTIRGDINNIPPELDDYIRKVYFIKDDFYKLEFLESDIFNQDLPPITGEEICDILENSGFELYDHWEDEQRGWDSYGRPRSSYIDKFEPKKR